MPSGHLVTGVASGASARWTSSVGGGNNRVRLAYYRYDPALVTSEAELLLEAREAFQDFLISDSGHPKRIQSDIHLVEYLYVMLESITAKVVKVGLVQLVATYGGSAQQPQQTGASSDTVMIYTKGEVDSLYGESEGGPFGFPDESLINQLPGESPLDIDLTAHRIDAFQRSPFTRSMISYKPSIIDYKGAFASGWPDVVGRTNSDTFTAYLGDDYRPVPFGPNRVRLNSLVTVPKPLLSKDRGIAWQTTFDFTISSTQFVDQGIEVTDESDSNGDVVQKGKVVYLKQYQQAPFPQFYSP